MLMYLVLQRFFVITRDPSRDGLKEMLDSEVSYCLKNIENGPSNESPWRYLRGLFKNQNEVLLARKDVINFCLRHSAEVQGTVHALNLLLDLLSLGFEPSQYDCGSLKCSLGSWSSPGELSRLVCTRLEEVDPIRAQYWAWRRSIVPNVTLS
jgi:protein farnesyltransferase/geranylgeranyltransferase type-1 subunit alpha